MYINTNYGNGHKNVSLIFPHGEVFHGEEMLLKGLIDLFKEYFYLGQEAISS